jgi:ribosomal protein L37AE/L43A
MVEGTALLNELVTFKDGDFIFSKDNENRGCAQARVGVAEQVRVWKCTKCGHSFTK